MKISAMTIPVPAIVAVGFYIKAHPSDARSLPIPLTQKKNLESYHLVFVTCLLALSAATTCPRYPSIRRIATRHPQIW